MPVVVIAPHDRIFEKTVSNMPEVAARGGRNILMTDAKGAAEANHRIAGDHHHADMAASSRRWSMRCGSASSLSYRGGLGTDVDRRGICEIVNC